MPEQERVIILRLKDEVSAAARQITASTSSAVDALKRHESALKAVAVGGGIAAAGLGLLAKAAADEEAGIVRLTVALRNVGITYAAVEASLEGVIAATQRKTGIADDQQREAMQHLLFVTKDYELSLLALPAVLDLATARGMDFASAGQVVGRALTGNTEMLGRYGIELAENASATQVLAELTSRFGGTAEAMGDTAAGAMLKLKASLSDTAESFGQMLLPAVTKAADALRGLADTISALPGWVKAVGLGLMGAAAAGGLVAGLGLLAIKLKEGITAVLGLAKALGVMQAMSGPAGIAAALGGVAVAVAISQMDLFKAKGVDAMESVGAGANQTAAAIRGLTEDMTALIYTSGATNAFGRPEPLSSVHLPRPGAEGLTTAHPASALGVPGQISEDLTKAAATMLETGLRHAAVVDAEQDALDVAAKADVDFRNSREKWLADQAETDKRAANAALQAELSWILEQKSRQAEIDAAQWTDILARTTSWNSYVQSLRDADDKRQRDFSEQQMVFGRARDVISGSLIDSWAVTVDFAKTTYNLEVERIRRKSEQDQELYDRQKAMLERETSLAAALAQYVGAGGIAGGGGGPFLPSLQPVSRSHAAMAADYAALMGQAVNSEARVRSE